MTKGQLTRNHWLLKNYRQKVTTAELRNILLKNDNFIFRDGYKCIMKTKELPADVHEIWFERE